MPDLRQKDFDAIKAQSENIQRQLYVLYQEVKKMGDVLLTRNVFQSTQFAALTPEEQKAFILGFSLSFHFSRNLMEADLVKIDPAALTAAADGETFRGREAAAYFNIS